MHVATSTTSFVQRDAEDLRFQQIIGNSPALRSVLEQVELVGPTDSTVLILGETGTGKELIARAVHNVSSRFGRPFVKLNCAAIPSGLLESELFGHEKGAFTGAIAQRIGRFEAANGGTLFLDEVGDIPLELQAKLLRVLQEQEFERLGSTYTRRVDVRVVSATNQDLAALVDAKQFRMDLYYRLNIFPISLPPLRQRVEDIPVLAQHFVDKCARRMSKRISRISSDAIDSLSRYRWPGNIRELQNFIERSVILTKGDVLQIPALPISTPVRAHVQQGPLSAMLLNQEREIIEAALEESQGRISGPTGAAGKLGMPPQTLESKVRRLRINKYQFKFAQA
jgi:formate hydrogenlyase transcriptional activator